jgi:phosphoribosylformylglycinamidine synthase
VSLYNETNGKPILPTPAIGGVGLISDIRHMTTLSFKNEGDAIVLIGGYGGHLGQSLYLREVHGLEDGPPPPVDLSQEKRNGDFVRALIRSARVSACHDVSDGGLLVSIAEMALAGGIGAIIAAGEEVNHVSLFAEDQARYVVTCSRDAAEAIVRDARDHGVEALAIGHTEGRRLIVEGLMSISLDDLRQAHEGWFPAFMDARS